MSAFAQLATRLFLRLLLRKIAIVLSHDFRTMETHAVARLTAGKPMPGLFLINQYFPVGRAIEEIVVIAECSEPSEWIDQIIRLPL